MGDLASLQAMVYGRVQGVNFRAFTSRRANELGLTGYVSNMPGGREVEVRAEGEKSKLEKLLGYLKVGPPGAIIERVEASWAEYSGNFSRFNIRYF